MKKIKVIIKNKTLLELLESAETGDLIDLQEVSSVDSSFIDLLIDSEKEKAVAARIEDAKKRFKAESDVEISKLNSQIESLKKDQTNALVLKEKELNQKHQQEMFDLKSEKQTEIEDLKHKIESLTEENNKNLEIKARDVAKEYSETISELKQQIENLKNSKESDINQLKTQNELDKNNLLSAAKEQFNIKEDELNKTILVLKNEIELLKGTQKAEIEKIKSENETEKTKLQQNESEKYSQLQNKYDVLNSQVENKVTQAKNEVARDYEHKISEINSQNQLVLAGKDAEIKNKGYEYEIQKSKALQDQKDMYEQQLRDKDETISNLQRAKAALNVKQTGEDLEAWCDNEVTSCMQNGFFNCTWEKDNKVVKDEGETKGSKADYIFRIYASELHKEDEELASVCMDMKDENPDSVNKKTNADYYKQLDKNREKKKCKYALLVSNLEMDKPNALPIFKVSGYDDMYVVRPAYLMTFLNMITSLTAKFADIIMDQENEVGLKTKFALMQEFEDIKNTYLDKPLGLLEKAIEEISKNSNNIRTAVQNIDAQCDKINESYINQIQNKIDKYEIKFNGKILKKLPENE